MNGGLYGIITAIFIPFNCHMFIILETWHICGHFNTTWGS